MYIREVDGEQYLHSGEEITCKQTSVEKSYCSDSFVSQDAFVEYQALHADQHVWFGTSAEQRFKRLEHEVDCLDGRLAGVSSSIRQESVERDKKLQSWVALLAVANFATFCILITAMY